ncbi:MetQ/NlpA family ABC transporter substrate-binding protein [Propioniciclava soli]|uniref:MetQ/NlpA family ABC transporter substrate-binding protein n=1 Tax=Propioniciclava soli TaxID=2775081 RepID=A0ABZ3CBC3_9ACTN|nr:MetQ/NlpA family ABC transporter substrate-binding protein [Propioniciclava soli]
MRFTKPAAALAATFLFALAGCGSPSSDTTAATADDAVISVGVVGASSPEWTVFTDKAADLGIDVEIRDFTDYTTPNPAVSDGSLTANQFQHLLYLARYNLDNNADLVPIASTAIYPLALYSSSFTSVDAIPEGAQIAVPNDETNKSRAIHLLAENGLLTLTEGTGIIAAEENIDTAASRVSVAPMDAQQTVTALPSIAGAVVNNDFVNDAGLDPADALVEDDPADPSAQPYINVFVVRAADADNERLAQLATIFHDPDFTAALAEQSADSAVIVDETPEELQAILADVQSSLAG